MSDKGHDEYAAWRLMEDAMEDALDSYEQGREVDLQREATKLGPDGQQQLDRFNKAADALVKNVFELAGTDSLKILIEMGKMTGGLADKRLDLVTEHVCITFGWEVMGMLNTARERFLGLMLRVWGLWPSDHARNFLQRVARCYLFGFDSECIVMCRAVLDQEFSAEIAGDDVEDWWVWYKSTPNGKTDRRERAPHTLGGRIDAAEYKGRLRPEEGCAAHKVKNDGDKAVHQRPSGADPLDYIVKTLSVLAALERGRK